jgi:hypothetical protein
VNLAPILKHTVSYTPKSGETDWSDPTFGAAQTLPARVEKKQRMVRGAGTNALPSDTQVLLGPTPEPKVGDRIDVGDGGGPRDVMGVDNSVDFWGRVDAWMVYL